MEPPAPRNGWSDYQQYVIRTLEDLKNEQRATTVEMTNMRADIATLKVKAGVWGGLAGLVPFGLFMLSRLFAGGAG